MSLKLVHFQTLVTFSMSQVHWRRPQKMSVTTKVADDLQDLLQVSYKAGRKAIASVTCAQCHTKFVQLKKFKDHVESDHPSKVEEFFPVECSLCDYRHLNQTCLNRHRTSSQLSFFFQLSILSIRIQNEQRRNSVG